MDDAHAVRVDQRAAQLDGDQHGDLGVPDRVLSQKLLQRLAVDEFRDQVGALRVGARVVEDLQDVVVPQLRHRLRLALEPRLGFGLGRQVAVQHLDRHLALQAVVLRAVHDRHATLADLFDQPVARGNGHCGFGYHHDADVIGDGVGADITRGSMAGSSAIGQSPT